MTVNILTVPLGDRSYDIFFGQDIYPLFQEWICRFFPGGSVFVVTDRNVAAIYGGDIARWLAGIPHTVLALPPGEENKTWEAVREIYAFLARGNADREALVVAFGGGVVGDLAGFAAATFLRGVPCIQIPTTLLAQVDSSVGGKTGFNLPEGKNLVGAFHQPRAVFIDQTFLRTLDGRNMRAGMAEAVKCAVAGDAALWETLSGRSGRWEAMSIAEWETVVRAAVAFKIAVVAQDERESSTRRVLNLGHTIGHALEQAAGYGDLLHGEAVAMGLAWEAILGRRLGETPPAVEERIVAVLRDMGFALDVPDLPLSSIAAAVGMDKKRVAADIALPVVTAPGRCVIRRVAVSRIRAELPAIRAEIRERLREEAVPQDRREMRDRIGRGEGEAVVASLEKRIAADPRDVGAMIRLAESYRLLGKRSASWETIKAALDQDPANTQAQRLARTIADELRGASHGDQGGWPPSLEDVILLEDGVFALRPADEPHTRSGDVTRSGDTPASGSEDVPGPDTGEGEEHPSAGEEASPPVAQSSVAEPRLPEEEGVPLDRRESPVDEGDTAKEEDSESAEETREAPFQATVSKGEEEEGEAKSIAPGTEAATDTGSIAKADEPIPEVVGPANPAEPETAKGGVEADESPAGPSPGEEHPPDVPVSPIRTITMATLYWDQGERETARRIVAEILDTNPRDARALAWLREHPAILLDEPDAAAEKELPEDEDGAAGRERAAAGDGDAAKADAERALIAFLEAVAKEYGDDVSGPH